MSECKQREGSEKDSQQVSTRRVPPPGALAPTEGSARPIVATTLAEGLYGQGLPLHEGGEESLKRCLLRRPEGLPCT